jgi:hypothetical protein
MTKYTIYAKTPEQWGRGILKLLAECQDVQEVNELQDAHENTFNAVRQSKPNITDYVELQFANRRNTLAQKP